MPLISHLRTISCLKMVYFIQFFPIFCWPNIRQIGRIFGFGRTLVKSQINFANPLCFTWPPLELVLLIMNHTCMSWNEPLLLCKCVLLFSLQNWPPEAISAIALFWGFDYRSPKQFHGFWLQIRWKQILLFPENTQTNK